MTASLHRDRPESQGRFGGRPPRAGPTPRNALPTRLSRTRTKTRSAGPVATPPARSVGMRSSPRWCPRITGRSPWCSRRSGGVLRVRAPGRRVGRGSRRRSRGRSPCRRWGRSRSRSSQERMLGVELVVPGRVERVGDVEPAAVVGELEHVRAAAEVAAGVARLADHAAEPELPGQLRVRRVGDVVLAEVAVQPVGEVEEAVVHREDEVGDQARAPGRASPRARRSRPRSPARRPRRRCPVEVPHDARQRGADEALLRVGVVEPAHLERDQALLAEVDRLLAASAARGPRSGCAGRSGPPATSSRSKPGS